MPGTAPTETATKKSLSAYELAERSKEKAKAVNERSAWLRTIALILAIVGLVVGLTDFIVRFIFMNEAMFYRDGYFAVHFASAVLVFGAYMYANSAVLGVAFAVSIFAFLCDLYAACWESARVNQCCCGSPVTTLDQLICTNDPRTYYINLIFAWTFTLFAVLQIVVCYFWLQRVNEVQKLSRDAKVYASLGAPPTSGMPTNAKFAYAQRALFIGQKDKEGYRFTAAKLNEYYLGSKTLNSLHLAIGILGSLYLLSIIICMIIDPDDAWMFRAGFLNVAGFSFGASLVTWGVVSAGWPWVILATSLVGLVGTIAAAVLELKRQINCPAFNTLIEKEICLDGGEGTIIPISSVVLTVMLIVSVVLAILSLVNQKPVRRAV